MTTKADCKTQWHVIVAHLRKMRSWQPTHLLQSRETDFGFIGSSGEQRVRELAVNSPRVIANHPELKDKIEKAPGSRIGLDPRYEYFRYRPQLTPVQAASERCRRFDAGLPAEEVLAI